MLRQQRQMGRQEQGQGLSRQGSAEWTRSNRRVLAMNGKGLDFSKIKTYSARNRHNLVTVENVMQPCLMPEGSPSNPNPAIEEVARAVVKARQNSRPVIWFMGAHVIKRGLSLYVIDLIDRGILTHVAGNGAVSIHDFELAYLGGTSEHVPTAIEDGSFGMWEETGLWMNTAIKEGYSLGLGYGESLAHYIGSHPGDFPFSDYSVTARAAQSSIPVTFHITIGTDIIHQHPSADFESLGGASGRDFRILCESVSQLDKGVFLNFGSAVTGAEVFLKALSISRNLGFPTYEITTANFDLVDLGNYRSNIDDNHPHYYYRPRKNIVNRPTSQGGAGYHITGDHRDTIPALYSHILRML